MQLQKLWRQDNAKAMMISSLKNTNKPESNLFHGAAAELLSHYSVASLEEEYTHVVAHSTGNFVHLTAIFERWICQSWKVIPLISSLSLDECMLISKITCGKPKRPKNHFTFSQRYESWRACHGLWRMHRCFLVGGFSVSKQEASPYTQTHTILHHWQHIINRGSNQIAIMCTINRKVVYRLFILAIFPIIFLFVP